MRSLIVVTILCLTSTPAFACVFHTDCNPGATCEAGVCSDQRGSRNDDPPSGNAQDNTPTTRKGKSCSSTMIAAKVPFASRAQA